ncbi:hypothetical protein YP76_11375 [Sphingobium chungbukense]|uniref:TonB-dependent receptor n=1 Tax=Sphingobium chungbukense TaxID=56193 RepID=A0A0M3API0_9SPHN|nr:hypothetical protein YP76_11375 [Sphingobium chungbukense]
MLSLSAGSALAAYAPACAQTLDSQNSTLGDIVVTAQRREEKLQEVPIAVTAFDAASIDRNQIATVQNIASQVPNLWMESNTGLQNGARAALRGIGEDESFFTADAPVGIYVDDIYIPRQNGALFDLYDIERIEVLRGPQGTLYGRNTSAGAIKLVSRKPDADTRAMLEVTGGNYDRIDVKASLSGEIASGLSGQVAFLSRNRDGVDLNLVNNKRVNDQDVLAGRASLRWQPSDSTDILLSYDQLRDRSTPGYAVGVSLQPPNDLGPWDKKDQYDGDTNVHTLRSDLTDPISKLDQRGVSLTASFDLGGATLKSISAWREMTYEISLDADGQDTCFGANLPCLHLYQDQKQDQLSQELQLSGRTLGSMLDYVVGGYWFKEKNSQITENAIFVPLGQNPYSDVSLDAHSIALYGSGSWHFSDRLTVTTGLRWTRDTKDFDAAVFSASGIQQQVCVAPTGRTVYSSGACTVASPAGAITAPLERQIKKSWSSFTPRIAVDYTLAPGVMLYGSVSKGFKSGGFDGRESSSQLYALEAIAPEKVLAYEAGVKADWFDRRLRTNLALFTNKIDDLQGTGTNQQTGALTRFSVGDVRTKGAELEVTAVPAPGVELFGSLGLLDTKYTKINFDQVADCGPVGTGTKSLKQKFAPKFSSNVGINYNIRSVLGGAVTMGGNWTHKSSFYHSSCNAIAAMENGYDMVDAQIAWETDDTRWRLAFAVKNLTNESYATGNFFIPSLGFNAMYFNAPRTWTLSARYSFN